MMAQFNSWQGGGPAAAVFMNIEDEVWKADN